MRARVQSPAEAGALEAVQGFIAFRRWQWQQAEQHFLRSRTVAHQADAPDLAGEITEACTDFQVEFVQQPAADDCVIDALRNVNRVQLRQSGRFLYYERNTHRFQARLERIVV